MRTSNRPEGRSSKIARFLRHMAAPLACCLWLAGFMLLAGCHQGEPVAEKTARRFVVTVAGARLETLGDCLEAAGEVKPLQQAVIIPAVPGKVAGIQVKEGQEVSRGQVLIQLENTSQYLQLRQAQAGLEALQEEQEKVEYLVAQGALPEKMLRELTAQIRQAELSVDLAKHAYDLTVLKSPIRGTVTAVIPSEGDLVGSSPVVTVISSETMLVQATVAENQLHQVQEGQAVQVKVPAVEEGYLTGKITAVGKTAIPGSRSFLVEAEVENPEGKLQPGMFAYLKLEDKSRQTVAVPASALLEQDGKAMVFVSSGNRAWQRVVETGVREKGLVEIIRGLDLGERYLVHLPAGLQDGDEITEIYE